MKGATTAFDLSDRRTVLGVAARAGLAPTRRFGQNFLVDRDALDRIVDALGPRASDCVFEIGPGVGTLTQALAVRAGRVTAVDLDPRCIAACRITLRGFENVTLIEGDALRTVPTELGLPTGYLATGNIPYNLTGLIVQYLLELAEPPRRAVLLVQREVAARLAAGPGDWSLATVAARSLADVERLGDVPPQSFHPVPAVHSSILRLTPRPALAPGLRPAVLRLARGAFQQRRKTLRHALTNALRGDAAAAAAALEEAGIDPGRRPGTLTLAEWGALAVSTNEYPGAP